MAKWRIVGANRLAMMSKERTNMQNPNQAEGSIWRAKIDRKLSMMTEEEKTNITVTEYPEVDLSSEAEMRKKLQGS